MAGLIVALLLAAQATALAFDAASIKENTSLQIGGFMRLMPGGGITAQNMRARSLITAAYQIESYQLAGAPAWTRNTRYDVIAKAPSPATRDQIFPMLQALLVERFKMSAHHERRRMDGYALVRVQAERLGAGLRPSAVDCVRDFAATPRCRENRNTSSTMNGVGVPVRSLLEVLIGQLEAPVSDETSLAGVFDVTLQWSSDPAAASDAPSIFIAVQEQLGLKLERRTVTTDVVVVEHFERPTPD